ncbi:hypothetical protein AB6A40_003029 [Gnathostoma spinigerum]|uniref:Phospholipase B1, membrane-associated n=1 Tax=Gnathostoma spinigerum TaxID=75299 RepID=A0ABD6EJ53_9BILA
MKIVPLLIFIHQFLFVNATVERIAQMLQNDAEFSENWFDLVQLQDAQSRSGETFTTEEVVDSLQLCTPFKGNRVDQVDNVPPAKIDVYAEFGHLSKFCDHRTDELLNETLAPCSSGGYDLKYPSLDKFFKIFNPNLTVISSPEMDNSTLTDQMKHTANKLRRMTGYKERWKALFIFASIEDGEISESGQSAVEILEALEEIYLLLPERTLIFVVRCSDTKIWRSAALAHPACESILSYRRLRTDINSDSVWDQVETISSSYFQSDLFSVQVLPLLEGASLRNLSDGSVDLSAFGYDCTHFSARGLSLFHLAIWNSLLSRMSSRQSRYLPVYSPPICPDPACPFVRTQNNSVLCLWSYEKKEADPANYMIEQSLAIGATVMMVLLCVTVFAIITMCRPKNEVKIVSVPIRIQKISEENGKPVGEDWNSIKYIDEDDSNRV